MDVASEETNWVLVVHSAYGTAEVEHSCGIGLDASFEGHSLAALGMYSECLECPSVSSVLGLVGDRDLDPHLAHELLIVVSIFVVGQELIDATILSGKAGREAYEMRDTK